MSYLQASADALGSVFTMAGLIGLAIGIGWGLVVSFMPGVGGNVAMALLLPFVFRVPVAEAIALLLGTHIATYFGGSITSITLNIPASAKSVSLCWDGYPLARKGKAAYALGASATASSLGGVVGAIVLTLGIPVMKSLLNVIGPPEIFILAVWGVVIIAIFSSGDLLKGVMAGGFGVLLSWVGESPITGIDRLTFGSTYLSLGLDFATAAIGLFAVGQALRMLVEWRQRQATIRRLAPGEQLEPDNPVQQTGTTWSGGLEVLRRWRLSLYMSLFGVFTGTVPGLGAPVAAIAAYGQASQMSKNRADFGKGAIDGVIAPQATDSAAEGGGMLPMLALGIPTHEQQAILLSGFVVLGLAPGPTMLTEHLSAVFTVIWIIVIASLIVGIIGMLAGRSLSRLSTLSPNVLIPLILSVAIIGGFAINGRIGDSVTTIIFGLIGYLCLKFNYSRVNLIIGFALGPIFETNLHLTTQLYGNDFVFHRPGAAILSALVILTVIWWFWKGKSGQTSIEGESLASPTAKSQRPGWAALGMALAFVALFAMVTAIGSTYGRLTGGVLTVVSTFCLAFAVINFAMLLRARLRHAPLEISDMHGRTLATAGVAAHSETSGNGPAVASSVDLLEPRNVQSAGPSGRAGSSMVGGSGGPAQASASASGELGGGDSSLGRSHIRSAERERGAGSLLSVAMQRHGSRVNGRLKGNELTSMAIVVGFLVVVLVFGMTPGVGAAMALYRLYAASRRTWKVIVSAALWGLGTSLVAWLLFDTLVNQYFPYTGILHTG
jgi:TctA family transporter